MDLKILTLGKAWKQKMKQVIMLSNFAFIGGMEIHTREGKTNYQEILYRGKQSGGRMPAFPLPS